MGEGAILLSRLHLNSLEQEVGEGLDVLWVSPGGV